MRSAKACTAEAMVGSGTQSQEPVASIRASSSSLLVDKRKNGSQKSHWRRFACACVLFSVAHLTHRDFLRDKCFIRKAGECTRSVRHCPGDNESSKRRLLQRTSVNSAGEVGFLASTFAGLFDLSHVHLVPDPREVFLENACREMQAFFACILCKRLHLSRSTFASVSRWCISLFTSNFCLYFMEMQAKVVHGQGWV